MKHYGSEPPDPSTIRKSRIEDPPQRPNFDAEVETTFEITGDGAARRVGLQELENVLSMDDYDRALDLKVGGAIEVDLRGEDDQPTYRVGRRCVFVREGGSGRRVRVTVKRVS